MTQLVEIAQHTAELRVSATSEYIHCCAVYTHSSLWYADARGDPAGPGHIGSCTDLKNRRSDSIYVAQRIAGFY